MATVNKDFRVKNNINVSSTADTATVATHYFVETASDGVIRPKTLANVKSEIVTNAAVNSASATVLGNATAAGMTISAVDGTNEGGELLLKGAGANADWNFDNYAGFLRFFTGGNVKLSIKSTEVASTVPVMVPAATATTTSINIPHGTAPSAPTNGDVWTTTAGMYVRINGSTIGPLGTGGGGGTTEIFYQTTAPTSPSVGNIWVDSDETYVAPLNSNDYVLKVDVLNPFLLAGL